MGWGGGGGGGTYNRGWLEEGGRGRGSYSPKDSIVAFVDGSQNRNLMKFKQKTSSRIQSTPSKTRVSFCLFKAILAVICYKKDKTNKLFHYMLQQIGLETSHASRVKGGGRV